MKYFFKKLNRRRIRCQLNYKIKKRQVSYCDIYLTNRCNSRCLNCNIWRQEKKVDLPLSLVEKIVKDPLLKKTKFCFHGGEIMLYPEIEKFFSLIQGINYSIVTNGIAVSKLIEIVKKYKVPEIGVSLDGWPKTNDFIRGVKGGGKIELLISKLKQLTSVTIFYTVCQNNNYTDYKYVKAIAKKNKVGFLCCMVGNPEFFGVNHDLDNLVVNSKIGSEEKFVKAFLRWKKGELNPGCHSIFIYTVIYPDGRVTLCQQKYGLVLGNINNERISEIWEKPETKELQNKYKLCNDCWLSCQRPLDLNFIENENIID